MLSRLFQQLFASIGVVFRTFRAFFTRTASSAVARFKSVTSLTRQAAKLAPAMMKTAATAGKKPTKREDYIETKQMFISKSFLIMLAVMAVSLSVMFYLVGWPWLVSQFFTAKLWEQDPKVEDYSGKVILFYDEGKNSASFEGRLEEGVIQGKGTTYDGDGLPIYSGAYLDGVYHGRGKLYEGGALVYDGIFAEGVYHGEGTLFGETETKLYEGGFAQGLYHGEGTLYGEAESLVYEGGFIEGLYAGYGKLYGAEEKLVYAGDFVAGLYEGDGKLYNRWETLEYEGSFVEGLYEGKGKLYNRWEDLIYVGDFAVGVRSGEGIAYKNGEKLYKGSFENDLYNGEGTLYDAEGQTLYKGGFLDGKYEGEGTLTLSAGVTLQASFQAGDVLGDGRLFTQGKLTYEGGLAELVPEGFGTLYSSDGKTALYAGPVKNGTIDGGALLGLPAEDIRAMLGGKPKESAGEDGFAITDKDLGLTVFCSYAQEDADPAVHAVYLYAPGDKIPSTLWQSAEVFETRTLSDEIVPEVGAADMEAAVFPVELPVEMDDWAYCRDYHYDEWTMKLWSREKDEAPLLAQWQVLSELPERTVDEATAEIQGSADRLASLLDQLGLLLEGFDSDEEKKASENPYYGDEDPTEFLKAVEKDERRAVLIAALNYFESAERRVADESNLALNKLLIQDEQEQVEMGEGDEERLAQLEDAGARLEVTIMRHTVQMEKDARTVEDYTGLAVEEYDLQALAVFFDVTELDLGALKEAALETAAAEAEKSAEEEKPIEETPAEETTGEDVAAGEESAEDETSAGGETAVEDTTATKKPEKEPAEEREPVDPEILMQTVVDSVLELELAYQDVQLALREYKTAIDIAEDREQGYATGNVSNADRISAQMGMNDQRAAFYSAVVNFARCAGVLNELTGGEMANQVKWLPDVIGS